MITVIDREKIRRAYYIEGKSMRCIAQEFGHSYWTIRKAIDEAEVRAYTLSQPRGCPVLGPFKAQIDKLLAEEVQLPPKQRYTSEKIYKNIYKEGYRGSKSGLRRYVGRRRRTTKRAKIYIPLEFDPGRDAQVDWGEAWVEMAGERVAVQLFVMRLCYSRKSFAMVFPTQRQEAFFTVRIPAKTITHSGPCRSLRPDDADHPFQLMAMSQGDRSANTREWTTLVAKSYR